MKTTTKRPSRPRGAILVLVLVVVAVLSLSVMAFSRFMLAERKSANHSLRQRQARLLAESGVEYLRIMLMKEYDVILESGGLYDNEDEFCGHLITDGTVAMLGEDVGVSRGLQGELDLREVGRFSVIAPMLSDDDILTGDGYRYGLEDESCKVNLRWIMQTETQSPGMGRAMLMRLPGVTEEIADSILDWMDEDSEEREYGAEDDYYAGLDPPYYTRNGIPDSIDDLLRVRGVTPKLLYGIDWNRNGIVDIGEPSESSLDEFDVSDGSLNLGLAAYLTLDSREANITPDGQEKINVNMEDLDELRELLTERLNNSEWVDYIISYRQQTSTTTGNTDSTGATGETASGTTINSLLDLVQSDTTQAGAQAISDATDQATGQTSTLTSPFSNDPNEMNDYLPMLYDHLTTSDTPIVGRININQATRTVLELFLAHEDELTSTASELASQSDATSQVAASLGAGSATSYSDISVEEIIEGILAERICDPNRIESNEMNYPFWPCTHGIVEDLETMKKLEPYFCTKGAVYKAAVVGRFDEQSPVVRLEVWLDATELGKPAKIIRIRELTELGPGYAAEMLGADEYSTQNR